MAERVVRGLVRARSRFAPAENYYVPVSAREQPPAVNESSNDGGGPRATPRAAKRTKGKWTEIAYSTLRAEAPEAPCQKDTMLAVLRELC